MGRYAKPSGYNTMCFNSLSSKVYKPFNGYISGSEYYAPGQYSPQIATLTFSAAPDDGSQITIPEGPNNNPGTPLATYTFVYAGVGGPGQIPLVAGGGTAAQAAAATQLKITGVGEIVRWTPVQTAATVIRLTSLLPGVTLGPASIGTTNITITTVQSALRQVLPGRFGRIYCFLANDTVNIPVPPS